MKKPYSHRLYNQSNSLANWKTAETDLKETNKNDNKNDNKKDNKSSRPLMTNMGIRKGVSKDTINLNNETLHCSPLLLQQAEKGSTLSKNQPP
jgi:hypothetical protein